MATETCLSQNERRRDEPDTKSSGVRWVAIQEFIQQIDRRPYWHAIYDLRGRGNDDAQEGHDREAEGNADDLWPHSITGSTSATKDGGKMVSSSRSTFALRTHEAKSGALVISVAMLLTQLMIEITICQPRADPCRVLG